MFLLDQFMYMFYVSEEVYVWRFRERPIFKMDTI